MNRRAILTFATTAPILALAGTARAADPDAAFTAAWERAAALESQIIGLIDSVDDAALHRLSHDVGDLHEFIATSPCQGLSGITAKLLLLKWVWDNGCEGCFEEELVSTALAALQHMAPGGANV
ncbi:MAG: hypothetical protein HY055_12740 [Magnetospirillum sp.]|nr:hypothetical protein [Magnetospirillum sp.]